MLMLHAGAGNKCLEQLTTSLKLEDLSVMELLTQTDELMKSLIQTGEKSYVMLKTANRIYPCIDSSILERYVEYSNDHFSADVKALNLTRNSKEWRSEVNAWLDEHTKHKVKELISAHLLRSSANKRMVIANAIHFQANWLHPFNIEDATTQGFKKNKAEIVKVKMLHRLNQDTLFDDNKELDCQVLELMFDGNEHGFVIILPNAVEGLVKLEANLNLMNLQLIMKRATRGTIDIVIPKFQMESELALDEIFSDLGMSCMFDSVEADFSGMAREQLTVDNMFHKAYVGIHEFGVEAAAGTSAFGTFETEEAPGLSNFAFVADHPFIFMIWDHKTDIPLFIGRYLGPSHTHKYQ